MDVFFEVYDWARRKYDLSRLVKIDMKECSIKIYDDNRLVVYSTGQTEDRDLIYQDAALKLESWVKIRESMKNDKYLHCLWQDLQTEAVEPASMLQGMPEEKAVRNLEEALSK